MAQARKGRSKRNPGVSEEGLEDAKQLSKDWHGRDNESEEEIVEIEEYDDNLAKLADLVELKIACEFQVKGQRRKAPKVVPIGFEDCGIRLTGKGNQLYLQGGNQEIDLEELQDELQRDLGIESGKQYVDVGQIYSITYWTDKWHLTGPKSQRQGSDYEHEFGGEGGELPELVYDVRNKKMMIVGGSYEIRSEGIYN